MRMLLLAVVVCGAVVAHADPAPRPTKPAALCDIACFGYSPSRSTWACGSESYAEGPMCANAGRRCDLQLLRDDQTIASVFVYSESASGTVYADSVVPLDVALRILPDDLEPVRRIPLEPDTEVEIPGTQRRIILDGHPDATAVRAQNLSNAPSMRVRVLCDPGPQKPAKSDARIVRGSALPSRRRDHKPTEAVILVGGSWHCQHHEQYELVVGPVPSQIAIVETVGEGCLDYSISNRRAHAIDVAKACED